MRRNETGMVRVQVEVGVDGTPLSVSIAASSQSRDLDRAALDAVRKWRFRPAQRDGQAVAGTVVVPIEFRL
jgi:protein TonB